MPPLLRLACRTRPVQQAGRRARAALARCGVSLGYPSGIAVLRGWCLRVVSPVAPSTASVILNNASCRGCPLAMQHLLERVPLVGAAPFQHDCSLSRA